MSMKRRDFLALVGAVGAGVISRPAGAQQAAKVPRIALVTGGVPLSEMRIGVDVNWSAFLDQMERHGFVEGRTVIYERFFAPNDGAVQDQNARRIIAWAPDAIFWGGAQGTTLVALGLNKTIPMIIETGDLLSTGMVSDIRRPGGNATGIAIQPSPDFGGKVVSVLAEAIPRAKRFAFTNTGDGGVFRPTAAGVVESTSQAAERLGLTMVPIVYPGGGGTRRCSGASRRRTSIWCSSVMKSV